MLDFVPVSMTVMFISITFLTLGMFYWALLNSNSFTTRFNASKIGIALLIWLFIQLLLSIEGVYNSHLDAIPPLIFVFGILPVIICIIYLFNSKKGVKFIKKLSLKELTLVNIVRIPVELCLFFLYEHEAIPEIMTFDGRNFDIIAGLSTPIIVLLAFRKNKIRRNLLLVWNIICLLLLLNIIFYGILSTPTPFQQFGFDQPNLALLNFPFSWLPTFVVPVVLFGHLASIWKLVKMKK